MANSLLISAALKSSGKTTVTMGLCAALQQRGVGVQPFKKGPDYIDPMWLSRAAQAPCRNLDFFTMSHQEIVDFFYEFSQKADAVFIEGNKAVPYTHLRAHETLLDRLCRLLLEKKKYCS